MSDTQSKIDKRRKDAMKRQAKNRKRDHARIKYSTKRNLKIAGAAVLACLLLAALIVPSLGATKRFLTAVTVGDTKISTAEYSYYYQTSFKNYYQTMVSYLGEENVPINLNQSLEKQEMSDGKSYADYFSENAVSQIKQLVVLASEAQKAGYTLSEEDQQNCDQVVAQVQQTAESSGMKVDDYLEKYYGKGFNLELFRSCIEREVLAQSYKEYKTNEPQYSQDQLEAYYGEHKQDFTTVDFRFVSFSVVDPTEDSIGVTADAARKNAEDFLEKVTDEPSFAAAALEKAKADAKEGEEAKDESLEENMSYATVAKLDGNLADWVFSDTVQVGDKNVVESSTGKTFYAVYLVRGQERDETNTVDVRHILVKVSDMKDADAKKTGEDKAKDLLEQWKESGATEDAFAQLANDHSDDTGSNTTGGLYEGVQPGQMVTNFNDWCFAPERKAGDTGIVETEYGYHVMYFVGTGAPTWQTKVESTMRTNDYNTFYEEASANYEASTSWLGLHFRNEPI